LSQQLLPQTVWVGKAHVDLATQVLVVVLQV